MLLGLRHIAGGRAEHLQQCRHPVSPVQSLGCRWPPGQQLCGVPGSALERARRLPLLCSLLGMGRGLFRGWQRAARAPVTAPTSCSCSRVALADRRQRVKTGQLRVLNLLC